MQKTKNVLEWVESWMAAFGQAGIKLDQEKRPNSTVVVLPTQEMAEAFSEERLTPITADSTVLEHSEIRSES